MRLRHATLARNLSSILQRGLLKSRSKGKLKAVWLHSAAQTGWATLHTIRRHKGRIQSVVILECDVPRSALRRSRRGLWYCVADVAPDAIRHVSTFNEISASPCKESVS